MPDPRIAKLAKVLIQYSLDLQPEEKFHLQTSPQLLVPVIRRQAARMAPGSIGICSVI